MLVFGVLRLPCGQGVMQQYSASMPPACPLHASPCAWQGIEALQAMGRRVDSQGHGLWSDWRGKVPQNPTGP